jgi:hypothetical protein
MSVEVRAPTLLIGRQPDGMAFDAPDDDGGLLGVHRLILPRFRHGCLLAVLAVTTDVGLRG